MPLLPVFFFIFSPSFLALSRRRKLAFGGGAFNLVRRRAYEAIGGHQRLASSVVDDIRLAMELKAAGFVTRTKLGMSLVQLRMYHGLKEIVDGFTKNAHAIWAGREPLMLVVSSLLFAVNLLPFRMASLPTTRPTAGSPPPLVVGGALAWRYFSCAGLSFSAGRALAYGPYRFIRLRCWLALGSHCARSIWHTDRAWCAGGAVSIAAIIRASERRDPALTANSCLILRWALQSSPLASFERFETSYVQTREQRTGKRQPSFLLRGRSFGSSCPASLASCWPRFSTHLRSRTVFR